MLLQERTTPFTQAGSAELHLKNQIFVFRPGAGPGKLSAGCSNVKKLRIQLRCPESALLEGSQLGLKKLEVFRQLSKIEVAEAVQSREASQAAAVAASQAAADSRAAAASQAAAAAKAAAAASQAAAAPSASSQSSAPFVGASLQQLQKPAQPKPAPPKTKKVWCGCGDMLCGGCGPPCRTPKCAASSSLLVPCAANAAQKHKAIWKCSGGHFVSWADAYWEKLQKRRADAAAAQPDEGATAGKTGGASSSQSGARGDSASSSMGSKVRKPELKAQVALPDSDGDEDGNEDGGDDASQAALSLIRSKIDAGFTRVHKERAAERAAAAAAAAQEAQALEEAQEREASVRAAAKAVAAANAQKAPSVLGASGAARRVSPSRHEERTGPRPPTAAKRRLPTVQPDADGWRQKKAAKHTAAGAAGSSAAAAAEDSATEEDSDSDEVGDFWPPGCARCAYGNDCKRCARSDCLAIA